MRITEEEKSLAEYCVAEALRQGASQARATLNKSTSDQCTMLNGETNKISHNADRSVYVDIFTDGRYGGYSTNRLDRESLSRFITRCIDATRLIAIDELRSLPDPQLCEKEALHGDESGLLDNEYFKMDGAHRLAFARKATGATHPQYRIVSEEARWEDSIDEMYLCDSNGAAMYKSETGYGISCDITIEGADGKLYESYDWEAASFLDKFPDPSKIRAKALSKAVDKMNAKHGRGGVHKMVVDREAASQLVGPLINALYGDSVYHGASFLKDSLGQQVFSSLLNIDDLPRSCYGHSGARFFDNEGCSTADRNLIAEGRVENFLLNCYYSAKLGLPRTTAGVSVPLIRPCNAFGDVPGQWDCDAIIRKVRSGILVTGFNGGNCNSTTGDFSYGVEGFRIKNGKTEGAVSEMLITGNMFTLWNNLLAAGNDPRESVRWLVPTLAFDKVCFAG